VWVLYVVGLEYLHNSSASLKRRRKRNPMPAGITGPRSSGGGDINTGTWPSRLVYSTTYVV
jgi:hypothetical protein